MRAQPAAQELVLNEISSGLYAHRRPEVPDERLWDAIFVEAALGA